MSTGKLLTLSETEEELRQLSWLVRITRDQVLKAAEILSPDFHDQVEALGDRLTRASTLIHRMTELLPSEPPGLPEPVRIDVGLDELRLSIDEVIAEVSSLIDDLEQISEALEPGQGTIVH
jgi:hypothetical protein